jgi:thiol-disulfide isomerase/thioredoxin
MINILFLNDMKTKLFTVIFVTTLLSGAYFMISADQVEPDEKASVIAMYMYADWCGACQAIKPKMAEATRQFEGQPILFTRMDMTDDFTAHQSKLLATGLGIQEIFEKNEGMTGFVLLIDADTHEILNKITTEDDTEGIKRKITAAIH